MGYLHSMAQDLSMGKTSKWSKQNVNRERPDYKSGALTTGPNGLQLIPWEKFVHSSERVHLMR